MTRVVSEATLAKLRRMGIFTSFDLLLHLPLRYEDRTKITLPSEIVTNQEVLIEGEIKFCKVSYQPKRSLVAHLERDGLGINLRFLHFYPSQQKLLQQGQRVRAFGVIRQGYYGLEMIQPKCEVVKIGDPTDLTLRPTYQVVAGIQTGRISRLIEDAMRALSVEDVVPKEILERINLPSLIDSLNTIHHPPAETSLEQLETRQHPAWQRIKFDELLSQQLSMRRNYRNRKRLKAPKLIQNNQVSESFIETLSFALTLSQKSAIYEISKNLSEETPMHRLLQGDVGCGKTIVAVLAALQALESGYQVAFMAPTEILAEQHYRKLEEWLSPLGINIVWLSGSQRKQEKLNAMAVVSNGSARLVVGTHALFQEQMVFRRLGLVIIDEQHKFGVQQRLALREKGEVPHLLMMSATPIPRTLAMSFYADLDVTVIAELPPGRTPISTKLVSDARRDEVIARIREVCLQGRQAYWVCSLIDESATLQLQTVEDTYSQLRTEFSELSVGMIHGRMKRTEKAEVMQRFKAGEISLLVATTVIEVGVDVPNASWMVIENAERMGLAQLHQLRGRVGRGSLNSTCILLFHNPLSDIAKARLKVIYENTDGFEIARQDMILRGPGEVLGAAQSGVPMLRFADLESDVTLLEAAREAAEYMLDHHPEAVLTHLKRWLGDKQDYLHV